MSSQRVDIRTDDVSVNIERSPLQFEYDLNHCRVMYRDRQGWKMEPGTHKYQLSFGPLENYNKLYEIHGHLERVPETCRKHTVDGKEYPGELHFLHYDMCLDFPTGLVPDYCTKYKSIICVLLEEGEVNTELSKITDRLPDLHISNKKISLIEDVDPSLLFPRCLDFWMYEEIPEAAPKTKTNEAAPDTSPGKTIWIIFKTPIQVSQEQLKALQSPYVRTIEANGATQTQIDRIISEGYAIRRISV